MSNVGREDRAQAQAFVDTWTWDDQADEGFQEIIANESGPNDPAQTPIVAVAVERHKHRAI